jgi:hypothetical protein
VFLVENSLPVEEVGSFEDWLNERVKSVESALGKLSEDDMNDLRNGKGDYADSPGDLMSL